MINYQEAWLANASGEQLCQVFSQSVLGKEGELSLQQGYQITLTGDIIVIIVV